MNRRPSPAQIEAGNYSKDHVSVHGLRVSIENPAGSTRRGVDADGKPWASKMHNDYGYIRGTTGRDKDHVDVFLSDSHRDSALPVHVVDQIDPATGEFDEHKVMLGWPDEDSAMAAYLKHYPEGWSGAKAVTAMSLPDFKKWAFQSGRRVKPVSELGVAKFCGGGSTTKRVKAFAGGGAIKKALPAIAKDLREFLIKQGLWDETLGGIPAGYTDQHQAMELPKALKDFRQTRGVSPREADLLTSGNPYKPDPSYAYDMWAFPERFSNNAYGYAMGEHLNGSSRDYSRFADEPALNLFVADPKRKTILDARGAHFDDVRFPNQAPAYEVRRVLDQRMSPESLFEEDPLYMTTQKQTQYRAPRLNEAIQQGIISPVKKYADGGAAFGFFPHLGRRAPENNDRAGSADMPLQAARGWAAGTAGLPGDVEGVMRTLIKAGAAPDSWVDRNMSAQPALPTSEFYKEWLPGAPTGAGGRAAMELGSLTGGAGAGTGARVLKKGADAAALGLGRAIDKGMQPGGLLTKLAPGAQPMYAVKPKGGNWDPSEPWDMLDAHLFGQPGDGMDAMRGAPPNPVRDWRGKQLQKYVRNLMGTADDPLLKLEKEGRLHLSPEDVIDRASQEGHFAQRGADNTSFDGDPTHLRLTGRPHRTPWEAYSDSLLQPRTPDNVRENLADLWGHEYAPSIAEMKTISPEAHADLAGTEWLDKIDPVTTPIWAQLKDAGDSFAGFEHVNDYLKAATLAHNQQASIKGGLEGMRAQLQHYPGATFRDSIPLIERGLHLSPDQLARTSVPDAVAKTAEWNKLLAEGKRLEDMNKGVKAVHRQYDTGHQWVELSPEGLAGEGKAMRHCVGGYCSSVESGDTRILSLRGKDGQPKVTVEVALGKPDENAEYIKFLRDDRENHGSGFSTWIAQKNKADPQFRGRNAMQTVNEYLAEAGRPPIEPTVPPPTIRQIKGPANRAPSAEVQAHVQDLVRNGLGDGLSGWGSVGDLRNSGLLDLGGKYVPEKDLNTLYSNHYGRDADLGESPAQYYQRMKRTDPRGLTDLDKTFLDKVQGLKAGGKVINGVRHLYDGGGGGDVAGGYDGGGYEGGYDGGGNYGGGGGYNDSDASNNIGGGNPADAYSGGNYGANPGATGGNPADVAGAGGNGGDFGLAGDYGGTGGASLSGGFSGGATTGADVGNFGGGTTDGTSGLAGAYGDTGGASLTGGLGGGAFGGVNSGPGYGLGAGLALGGPDVNAVANAPGGSKIADFLLGLAVPGYGLLNGLSKATTDKSLSQQLSEAFSNFGVGSGTQSTDRGEPDHGEGLGALGSVLGSANIGDLAPDLTSPGATATPPWADPLALGTHALRVYDPVFAPGTLRPTGY